MDEPENDDIIKDYVEINDDNKQDKLYEDDDYDLLEGTRDNNTNKNTTNEIDNAFEYIALLKSENEKLKYEVKNIINEKDLLKQNYDFEKSFFNQTQKKMENITKQLNEIKLSNMEWEDKYYDQNQKYQQLKQDNDTQNQLLQRYKQQNNILQQQFIESQNNKHIECNKLIQLHSERALNFKKKYNNLLQKYNDDMKTDHNNNNYNDNNNYKDSIEYVKKIEQLQNDLAHAQRSILEMTNVVGVKQLLPTVQETLTQFCSLRDQQHHNTYTKLKQYIKQLDYNWQKYYINQTVHQILFHTIIKCYEKVVEFKQNMFDVIANELNMYYTLKNNNISDECINNEINKILSNRFGSYFKDNYKTILKTKIIAEKVKYDILSKEYSKCLSNIESCDSLNSLNEFIIQCLNICWVMILQDPPLHFKPITWKSKNIIQFDNKIHKRVLGSDKKCTNILYCVWPVISRNRKILDDQKIEVILRDNMYSPFK
eukprot:264367_1